VQGYIYKFFAELVEMLTIEISYRLW